MPWGQQSKVSRSEVSCDTLSSGWTHLDIGDEVEIRHDNGSEQRSPKKRSGEDAVTACT